MRAALACLACTACGFEAGVERRIVGARGLDAPLLDAPIDAAPVRTRTNLIGLWTFDEASGPTIADTSDSAKKVPLTVTFGAVTFANSTMTPTGAAVIASAPAPHLNPDVMARRAVTLEAWVIPALADQGTAARPVLVAGLCGTINTRNVSLLQVGRHWVARVRTTADQNGLPELTSTAEVRPGALTHLVVVADATQRALYVDGTLSSSDASPTAPLGWDKAYKVALGNELAQGRQWAGSFALVALFNRVLTKDELAAHFAAGP